MGCYLIVIGAVFYALSETMKLNTTMKTVLCNFVPWTANIGLTLILATVCLKTVLFLVDVLVCIIWSVIDPLKPKEFTFLEKVGVIVTDIKCESMWTATWLLIIISYKGTTMLLSLTFALLTRKIILEQFKTNNVVMLVYLLSIISSISVLIYLIIRVTNISIVARFVVVSILLNSAVYICLFVLFLPPMIPLFREKYCNYRLCHVPQEKREGNLSIQD